MANVFIEEQTMTDIGNAIRTKNGTTELILPEDMPEQILAIESRVFTWEKYSVIDGTTSNAYSQQTIENKYGTKLSSTLITLYSSWSFDADTGVYTLSGATTDTTMKPWGTIYSNKTYETYPYYYVDDAHTKVAKIASMTPPKTGSIVQNYGVNYTEYYALANEQGIVKGDYIEDITSTSSYEYPADGYQDGYWYVLKSEGGSGGSLEGLENGYDVMFYDDDGDGLALYSIKQGNSINPPVYSCKSWQTEDGTDIVFPYTPIGDVSIFANNNTYAKDLYDYYGVDESVYPYVAISITKSSSSYYYCIIFGKSIDANNTNRVEFTEQVYGCQIIYGLNVDTSNVQEVVEYIKRNITLENAMISSVDNSCTAFYTNFEPTFTPTTTFYRLDE